MLFPDSQQMDIPELSGPVCLHHKQARHHQIVALPVEQLKRLTSMATDVVLEELAAEIDNPLTLFGHERAAIEHSPLVLLVANPLGPAFFLGLALKSCQATTQKETLPCL